MVSNAIETESSYWYGYPPWAMWSPEPVPGSAPFRTDPGLVRVQQIHRVRPSLKWSAGKMERRLEERKASPHLGQNIDRYV